MNWFFDKFDLLITSSWLNRFDFDYVQWRTNIHSSLNIFSDKSIFSHFVNNFSAFVLSLNQNLSITHNVGYEHHSHSSSSLTFILITHIHRHHSHSSSSLTSIVIIHIYRPLASTADGTKSLLYKKFKSRDYDKR